MLLTALSNAQLHAQTTQPSTTQPTADEPTLAPNLDAKRLVQEAPESVDETLIEAAARPPGLLPYGPVSLLDPLIKNLNQSTDKYGLNVGFAATSLYQVATSGPAQRDAAGLDLDLFGSWRLLGAKDDSTRGALYFAAESRNDMFTGIAPGALGGEIGSLWGTTNGYGEQPLVMKELYWQQNFGGDRLILRLGKLDPENYYDSNYWQSDSKYFVNKAFSSFPVRAFPGQGLGMNVTAKLSDQWYISAGLQDAQGKKTTADLDTFFGDFNLFSAAEVGWTPTFDGLGRGTYRLTTWYRDGGETDGKSHDSDVDLSIDQHITPNLIPFFRAGAGEGNINGIDYMISAGIGWQGKLITDSDVVGLGSSWGKPSDHDLRDQYAIETFYRLQLSPDNQLTVGYQVIIDPSNQPDDDVVGVFEIRWRITI